ncbi:putative lipoyltransferase/lipoate-protein ligase [Septoria linicola]|nr:putative lipoyltransferase/lipoate-protein ligase [Septoria linicola]
MIAQRLRRSVVTTRCHAAPLVWRRWQTGPSLDRLKQPVQSYISTSRDPYLNLSIEHHLLQKSSPDSAILFLYINRPSIIIGRNQNPWLEVNLALLSSSGDQIETEPPGIGAVDLVRRRSGGGTVFHDEGNVNWTVICPAADFTRDKHAEMVVRALRSCGVDRARVNARHDIILDQGVRGSDTDPEDTHSTPYEATDFDTPRPLKVSGSAYKLTRNRALHHGTCLLNSPNLNIIPDYLHSPAKPFITAKGVESVSSPVGNILLHNKDFISAVQTRFAKQYDSQEQAVEVDEEWLQDPAVRKGYDELKSLDWTYLQTPQWSISSKNANPPGLDLDLSVRYGAINSAVLEIERRASDITEALVGRKVHEITGWSAVMEPVLKGQSLGRGKSESLGNWLNKMLPRLT